MARHDEIVEGFEREFKNLPHVFPVGCSVNTDGGWCGECDACENQTEFTWSACEVCNGLAGAREPLVAFERVGPDALEPIYFSVCADCLFYAAYGDLPEDS